jgi:hypothetical protein
MFHSYRCLHLQSYHSIQSRGSDFAIFAVAWRRKIMNDEADRFIASLESAGLEEVRTRLATDRYGEAGNRRAIAENWVRQKEREAEESAQRVRDATQVSQAETAARAVNEARRAADAADRAAEAAEEQARQAQKANRIAATALVVAIAAAIMSLIALAREIS